jgi:hypothetical protein
VAGKPNRGEDTHVPESRDDNAFAAHIVNAVTEAGCNMAARSEFVGPLDVSRVRNVAGDDDAIHLGLLNGKL